MALVSVRQRRETMSFDVDASAVAVAHVALVKARLRNLLAGVEAVSNVRHCCAYLQVSHEPSSQKRAQPAHARSGRRSQGVPKSFRTDQSPPVHKGNGLGTPSAHLWNA